MSLLQRKFLLPLHLWAGLSVGLILMIMAVTGALLAFRKQVEPRLDPHLFRVVPGTARLAPDELVARSRAALPGATLESVRYYRDPAAPFLAYYTSKDYVHLNPYTGEVLGVRPRYGRGMGWVEGLHKFLQLEPRIGEPITGYTATIFGFIVTSGLVLWWPATRKALKAGLTLNWALKGRPWNLNLHKTLGFYAAVVLLVSVLTGVPMSLDWAKDLLYPLTGTQKVLPPKLAEAHVGNFVGFNAVAQSLETLMPGAQETYIPVPKQGVAAAYVIEAGADHLNARSYAWFNGATGTLIRATPYRQAGAGFRLYYWMMSLHTGVLGGPYVTVILMLGALAVPVLAFTGSASFLRRKFGRRVGQAPAVAAPSSLAPSRQATT